MAERAAHLVDEVVPWVLVRQWVLAVPYRLRDRMAFDHGLSRAVLGVFTGVLLDAYACGARAPGLDGGGTGTVTVIQRARSGLNANPHSPTVALDGVFSLVLPRRGGCLVDERRETATLRHRIRRLAGGMLERGLE
jgi:hypothetical protein